MSLATQIESKSLPRSLLDYEDSLQKQVETALCAASVKYFAQTYVFIQNQETQKIVRWQPWPYLLDLFDIIERYDIIYILKASQLGASLEIAIYVLWVANFRETAKCLMISQGQNYAKDLLSKVSFIYDHLPPWLKFTIDTDNRESLAFRDNYAEIRALASTDVAGHGYQASLVARDEVSRHPYARDNFTAVFRAISSGGKLIEVSTANKKDQNNYFAEKTGEFYYDSLTQKAVLPSGVEIYTNVNRPNACLVFLSRNLRPTRIEGMTLDEWFKTRIVPNYTPLEIEEQFPERIEDVFRASTVKAFCDVQALEDMGFNLDHPIKQTEVDTYNGLVRVYKPPVRGKIYLVYTDPSDGVEDPFVTGTMDFVTGEVVASATGKIKADFVAQIHDYLVRTYNNATNSYEYTGSVGGVFGTVLKELGTPNQAPRRKVDGKPDFEKRGQYISGDYKKKILGDLAFAITKRQFTIHDREFAQQAKLVQRDESGNPLTDVNIDFDWVMMMAGLWQLQKFVPRVAFKAVTILR